MDYNALIDRIYEANNYPGLSKLVTLVKKVNPSITPKQIKQWFDVQLEIQLLHKQEKKEASGHIVADVKNEIWCLDIFDLSKYRESNNNYRYILAMVDVFTRRAWAEPMQTKDSETVGATLQSIMMEAKEKPRVILSDNDAAYTGYFFQHVLEDNKIILQMNTVGDHNALGIIDNFARRIKFIFSKMFIRSKNTRWISKLSEVIKQYNNTPHSSLGGLTPNEATEDQHKAKLVDINQTKRMYNKIVSDLEPGDKVRKSIKEMFTKGTEPKWSDEVYTVVKTIGKKVKLDDETMNLRHNLLQVPRDAETTETNAINQIKQK
jgi:transposase InsO family protein